MTIIYGFTLKEKKNAIITADNKSYGTPPRKADKICLLDKRYAVAVCGINTPLSIIGIIPKFECHSNYVQENSIEGIVNKITKCVIKACGYLYPQYKTTFDEGKISKEEWKFCLEEESTLIILDCLEYKLYRIFLGRLFPPEELNTNPDIILLEDNRFYSFALGEDAELYRKNKINLDNVEDAYEFTKNIYKEDINNINKHIPHIGEKIGEIGASVIVKNDEITFISSYSSVEELIDENHGKGLIGFTIDVLQTNFKK